MIEIVSEHHAEMVYGEKRPEYQRHRIPELWFVDQARREVLVDSVGETAYTTRTLGAGRLESAVLAGFWIDVAWLWQAPLLSTVDCFHQILR